MVRARQAGRKRASSFYITPDNPRQGQGPSFYNHLLEVKGLTNTMPRLLGGASVTPQACLT